jgi:hypothetical protein
LFFLFAYFFGVMHSLLVMSLITSASPDRELRMKSTQGLRLGDKFVEYAEA